MGRYKRLQRCLLVAAIVASTHSCWADDFTHAEIRYSSEATPAEKKAIALLVDEVQTRTQVIWHNSSASTPTPLEDAPMLFIARREQIASLLPADDIQRWTAMEETQSPLPSEGFTVRLISARGRSHTRSLIIAGNDSRGILFGVGYVLRKMQLSPGHAELPTAIDITTAPEVSIRGHQIGYRFKNNTYDAWTLPMFEQHIRDLAVFGTNTVQLIVPDSDDAPSSPLFPAPALNTLLGISRILDSYGLDCDIYYPELRRNYGDDSTVAAELRIFDNLFRQIPRVDALYIPGGDPGHTDPKDLFPLVEKEAAILHRYHPHAQVWISAQGLDQAWYEKFYALIAKKPAWLTGIFFGPQSRDNFETQRARIPAQYPLLFYPDIAHTMHAQFPVPHWDSSFALSEGREPINPRPVDETLIYKHFAALHRGFITYSEGVNDDVNKFIWTRLGWSSKTPPSETLRDYARYFIGSGITAGGGGYSSEQFADGLLALERNWVGPIPSNTGIVSTLTTLQAFEYQASSGQKHNWRFESALYRAYYDAYIQKRLIEETEQEAHAMQRLEAAPATGSRQAIHSARLDLQHLPHPSGEELRAHIFALADDLFHNIGLQLSVPKYGASGVERGANLDRMDVSLNNRVWLLKQFKEIEAIPSETERLQKIATIAHWTTPFPGTLYDDLGQSQTESHLAEGAGFEADPELYHSTIDGIADMTPDDGWRMSWINYAETLYEYPLKMTYLHLDPHIHYRVRITYAGEGYTLPLKLTANGRYPVHPFLLRPTNPATVEFPIPDAAIETGTLHLQWEVRAGAGGSGRGHQVAEVWLIPDRK